MEYIATYKQEQAKTDHKYRDLLLENFSTFYLVDPGLFWATPERLDLYEEGLDYLISQNKKVIGHCLIPGGAGFNRVSTLSNFKTVMTNYEEKQEMVRNYLSYMFKRFGHKISDWYVFNEVSTLACIAENAFGETFVDDVIKICRELLPEGHFRNNEYGFQNKNIIDKLINKSKSSKDIHIGLQVYTTGKNPLLGRNLTNRIKDIRSSLPFADIYFSEVSIINSNPLLISQAYKTIYKVANKNNIKEFGFWWPTDKYNSSCWVNGITSGLWDENLEPSKYYSLFFPQKTI